VLGEVDLRWPRVSLSRWQLTEGAVWPGCVVVSQVFGQYPPQVILIDDQQRSKSSRRKVPIIRSQTASKDSVNCPARSRESSHCTGRVRQQLLRVAVGGPSRDSLATGRMSSCQEIGAGSRNVIAHGAAPLLIRLIGRQPGHPVSRRRRVSVCHTRIG